MLERFRQLGPEEVRRRPNAGLFEYLSMSAAEQRARYMTNLTRMITTNPRDPGLKLRLGKAFLQEGKTPEALQTFCEIRTLTADGKLLAESGKTLLEYEQY